jgi:hypothetical protein
MEWRDVKGYEGRYEVSENGDLKSILKSGSEKKLKGSISKEGYRQFTLNWGEENKRNTYTGQQLVAMSFLGHIPNSTIGYVVDHINDNKLDNRVENLRLISNHANGIKRLNKNQLFGVTKKPNGRWYSKVWHLNKTIYLGSYNTEIEAHLKSVDYLKKNNIKRIIY